MVTHRVEGDRTREAYHHGNVRAAAIAAAVQRIRADGAPAFSLREVAIAIGVSHGALYRHFADRDALLAAVAAESFVALYEAHQAALAAAGEDGKERLVAICRAHFGFAVERPAEYRTMFNAFLNGAGRDDEPLQAAAQRALNVLVAAMAAWRQEIGASTPTDRDAAAALWSAVHGFTVLTLDGLLTRLIGDGDPRLTLEVIVATTLSGLAPDR